MPPIFDWGLFTAAPKGLSIADSIDTSSLSPYALLTFFFGEEAVSTLGMCYDFARDVASFVASQVCSIMFIRPENMLDDELQRLYDDKWFEGKLEARFEKEVLGPQEFERLRELYGKAVQEAYDTSFSIKFNHSLDAVLAGVKTERGNTYATIFPFLHMAIANHLSSYLQDVLS